MKQPYKPVDLNKDVRASQLPPSNGPLFWASIVNFIFWAVAGGALYVICA